MSGGGKDLLPAGLGDAVERATGATIAGVKPRGGGGASRQGAELLLAGPDGTRTEAYMNYDVHRAGAGDDQAFLREAAILEALSGPIAGRGVRTARFIAALPDQRALIMGKVAGEANFNLVRDPAERLRLSRELMAQVAALHAIDADSVPALGGAGSVTEQIRGRIAAARARDARAGGDPLVHLALDWLETHVPPEPQRRVIVHGDVGAGNFLFDGGEVTALLDWELVHVGDPMADLAMLCLRDLFMPMVPLPQLFAAYEAAGGAAVDVDRVRFWRLLFQTGFVAGARTLDPNAPPPPNLGMNMVFGMVHRRVLAEALAEAGGVPLPPVPLPEVPPGALDRSFAIALDDLRDVIVPRLTDQQAAVKAKGLARLVKWWQAHARYGATYAAAELRELNDALGEQHHDVEAARAEVHRRVVDGSMAPEQAIPLAYARVTRETALMAGAMGSFADTRFSPLTAADAA